MNTSSSKQLWTLLPFVVFITVFLGAGIYYNDFYALPSPVAISIGIVFAFLILPGNVKNKISTFLEGCGDRNILTMCIVYLLAGAFAAVSKSIGSVDAVVDLGIRYLSPAYYPAGIFVLASFLSMASGTSVGTIVALGPIAMGLSDAGGCDVHLVGAALLGGAMFGDNLSIISDTTIAATQLMGCEMRDKFKNNFSFVFPAAVVALILYAYLGENTMISNPVFVETNNSPWLVVPYLLVILLAFLGLDVFLVLVIGIVLSGIFGKVFHHYSFLEFGTHVYDGFKSMNEIFLLSLLTGGLAALVERAGGVNALLEFIKKKISGPQSALLGIGTFVGLTDAATANNTVSIVISGKVAKKITEEYNIKPRVTASILDTFSCIVQGIIPYGAQILILTSYSRNTLHYPELLKNSYYFILLFIATIIYILVGKTRHSNTSSKG